jgi:mannosyl-oligosaccharide alpha-1,3-glucosidase
VFFGPSSKDIFRQYTRLTGQPAMPQNFAIAYHQCRWNYINQNDVHEVDSQFDHHDIPYDVIWLDIEHNDGKRYFTWDNGKFPDPIKMQKELDQKGRKVRCPKGTLIVAFDF